MSESEKKIEEAQEPIPEEEKTNAETEEKEEGESFSFSSFVFELTGTAVVALVAVTVLLTFFCRQVTVSGTSMTDTLQDQDRLLITNFMYQPQYGDIIVITHGSQYDEPIIKRVIATQGQSLSINYDTGEVSVDGVILKEPYIKGKTVRLHHALEIPDKIPEGYVFVMGDNREGSLDSRSSQIGLIPVENIIGKAQARFYPFDKTGSVY